MIAALTLSILLGLTPVIGQDGTSGQATNDTRESSHTSEARTSLIIQPDTPAAAPSAPERKSGATAVFLSLGATLVPAGIGIALANEDYVSPAIIAAGAVFGPTAGYIYANEAGAGRGGLKFRIIAGGISGLLGLVGYLSEDDEFVEGSGAVLPLTIGGVLVGISAIRDIARVDGVVRAHNARITHSGISLVPTYSPAHQALGLRLHMTF